MSIARILVILTVASLLLPMPSSAVTTPVFTSCVNPQGEVIANYSTGVHGIVGDTATHTGSDTVYLQADRNVVQCFCPTDGQGIQTNWLKASAVSQDEVSVLVNSGWYFIPDGSAWGLEEGAYLAQNNPYTCHGTSNGGGGSTGGGGSSSSSNSGSSTGVVQAATTSVHNLANTGDMQLLLSVLASGVLSLIAFLLLKRFSK